MIIKLFSIVIIIIRGFLMKLKHTISLIGVVAVAGTSVCLSLPSCSGPTYDTK
jgi:hypothetical protein